MDVTTFCRKSRVLVVAGKGGVGKTTITAALARMAAHSGLSVLVIELEGKPGVPAAFGSTEALGYGESLLSSAGACPRLGGAGRWGRGASPRDALLEYLAEHGITGLQAARVLGGPRRGRHGHPRHPRHPGPAR